MPTYRYQMRTGGGEVSVGTIAAENALNAAQQLRNQGNTVLQLTPMRGAANARSFGETLKALNVSSGPSQKDVLGFTTQLSVMVRAGISLRQALDGIAEQVENPKFQKILFQIKQDVESGKPFSEALAKHPKLFGPLYINMVRASEMSGSFSQMLDRIAAYLAQEIETTDWRHGGDDVISSGASNDLVIGGTGRDRILAGAGNDLVMGDHARIAGDIDETALPLTLGVMPFDVRATFTGGDRMGGNDTVFAGAGQDLVMGQQGDDWLFGEAGDDDLIGGHNVDTDNEGALAHDGDDAIDGGADDDVILGDNGLIYRTGEDIDARMRARDGRLLYGFRGADIFTYIKARRQLHEERRVTLEKN